MGELFEITFERFLDEIKREKISPDGHNTIEMEDVGNGMFAFYLTIVGIDKTYVTVVEKEKITDFHKMNLLPVSKPARRINETADIKTVSETLKNLAELLNKLIPQ